MKPTNRSGAGDPGITPKRTHPYAAPDGLPGEKPHRRTLLRAGAALPLGILFGRRAFAHLRPADPLTLADKWRESSRDEAYALAASAIGEGLSLESFHAALLLATVHDIPPLPAGGPLHVAMALESAIQLTESATEREQWIAALWCLGDYLDYRTRVDSDRDWEERPPASGRSSTVEDDAVALTSALEDWDAPRADRALCALAGRIPLPSLFELLRPYSGRCFAGIGHKLLYAVQLERLLERIDAPVKTLTLRSLVRCLVYPDMERDTSGYLRARDLASELPTDWEERTADPAAATRFAESMKELGPKAAQENVVRRIQNGAGSETAWNALRLLATDIFLRRVPAGRRRHLPVHTVTELNAFDTSRRRTADPELRALLLLQASGWLAQLVEVSDERWSPMKMDGGLFTSAPEDHAPMPDVTTLLRTVNQDHQIKYAAAAREEAARGPAAFRTRILCAGDDYLPAPDTDPTERYTRAVRTWKQSGRG